MTKLQINQLPNTVLSAVKDVEQNGTRVKLLDDHKVVAEIIPGSTESLSTAHDPHGSDALAMRDSDQYRTMGESLGKR